MRSSARAESDWARAGVAMQRRAASRAARVSERGAIRETSNTGEGGLSAGVGGVGGGGGAGGGGGGRGGGRRGELLKGGGGGLGGGGGGGGDCAGPAAPSPALPRGRTAGEGGRMGPFPCRRPGSLPGGPQALL